MTKKAEPTDEEKLAGAVRSSAQQIWQAGLGAFARAQEEGGKVFSRLVKESAEREADADKSAEAAGAWDKLEQVFEDRVERALSKLGVYTQNDVVRLSQRVDALSDAVNELIKATGVSPQRPAAAKKRAAKKATGKTRAAKK